MLPRRPSDTALLRDVHVVAPSAEARALLRSAGRILGVDASQPGHRDAILQLCRVFADEGAVVIEMAEEIALELDGR